MRLPLSATLTLLLVAATGAPSAQSPTLKSAMRDKLATTTVLLEPVIARDFQRIGVFAERLSRISYTEISSWQARPDPEYIKQAVAFLDAVKGLETAAAAKDADRAAEEYGALVTSCVRCHRQVRPARGASLLAPPPVVAPRSAPPQGR
jgi:cytochrome c553